MISLLHPISYIFIRTQGLCFSKLVSGSVDSPPLPFFFFCTDLTVWKDSPAVLLFEIRFLLSSLFVYLSVCDEILWTFSIFQALSWTLLSIRQFQLGISTGNKMKLGWRGWKG